MLYPCKGESHQNPAHQQAAPPSASESSSSVRADLPTLGNRPASSAAYPLNNSVRNLCPKQELGGEQIEKNQIDSVWNKNRKNSLRQCGRQRPGDSHLAEAGSCSSAGAYPGINNNNNTNNNPYNNNNDSSDNIKGASSKYSVNSADQSYASVVVVDDNQHLLHHHQQPGDSRRQACCHESSSASVLATQSATGPPLIHHNPNLSVSLGDSKCVSRSSYCCDSSGGGLGGGFNMNQPRANGDLSLAQCNINSSNLAAANSNNGAAPTLPSAGPSNNGDIQQQQQQQQCYLTNQRDDNATVASSGGGELVLSANVVRSRQGRRLSQQLPGPSIDQRPQQRRPSESGSSRTSHSTKSTMSSSSSSRHSSSGGGGGGGCRGRGSYCHRGSSCSDADSSSSFSETTTSSGEPNLPYPGFPEISLKYLTQDTRPRNWCLKLITNPYPFRVDDENV